MVLHVVRGLLFLLLFVVDFVIFGYPLIYATLALIALVAWVLVFRVLRKATRVPRLRYALNVYRWTSGNYRRTHRPK